MRLVALLVASTLTGCLGGGAHEAQPPKNHAYAEDDGYDKIDHPEPTTAPPREPGATEALGPKTADPARPSVKIELAVVDVISWDEVKVRGGLRGSVVRGVVSLTGWLAGEKTKGAAGATTTQSVVVEAGHEAEIALSDPAVRDLVGPYAALRVAVLEANDKGDVDVSVDPLSAPGAGGEMTLATRVRVGSGEALVVGGHRSDPQGPESAPGDAGAARRPHDQLAILKATVVRSRP